MVSDYIPRRCGIATFTHDLCEAVAQQSKDLYEVFVVAMNDVPEGYPYPPRVRFEVRESVQGDYRLAADFLNVSQVRAVCLQHEYGLFGGLCGSHILGLLRRLRHPLVTTLHTVLKGPNDQQRVVLKEIGRLSDRMVVMSDLAHEILKEVYDVPSEKIVTIPHGIPDVPFVDPNFYKDQFGVEGKRVLLTFGLLSPGKGLEYVIEALPAIISRLFRRVNELGLSENVIFQNRFVEIKELCEFLGAADIYITPYLNEAQIVSGTLAYAMGAGKAIISTPYWYAREMLSDGRGRIVPFKDSEAIAAEVIHLFDNETERHAMRKKAYVVSTRSSKPADKPEQLPEPDLRHLRTLTDCTGILQHCRFSTPDRSHGYCTDDAARALIVAIMYWDQSHDDSALDLVQTYLSFLSHAMDDETGRFRNLMNYDRHWSEMIGSEDSHGRALWALGMGVALCPHESMIALATRLFMQGLPATEEFSSPRAWAFTIIGIQAYLRRFGGDTEARRYRASLAERLYQRFLDNMSDDWPWCEDVVTYSNAKLPHALLMCGKWMQRNEWIDLGKRSLQWLLDIQTNENGMLSIIGTNGWYPRGGPRASFDQQPVEVHALLDACVEAYRVTRENHWIEQAWRAFNWFLGDNDLRTPLYDFTTGGCRDGLHSDRVNENQGAESTLAWLLSLLLMQDLQTELELGELSADKAAGQRPVSRPIKPSGPVLGVKVNARPDRDG